MSDYYEENEIDSQLCPILSKGVVYPDNWVGTSVRVKYAFYKNPLSRTGMYRMAE
jgi:hypothetical protein